MFSHWTENCQRAPFDCIVAPVCQTDNLQMSAPGLGGCRPKECRGNAQAAWEQRDASWPWLPPGFKDTLTDSLSCVRAHTHTGTNTLAHVCALFLHICTCAHRLASRPAHTSSRMCTQAWLNTVHMHILYSHTQTHTHTPYPDPYLNSKQDCRNDVLPY